MNIMKLLSPVTVGSQVLQNRIVLAPMTRARCTPSDDPFDQSNAVPNDIMAEYYGQRSSAGLIITEATAISEVGSGWLNAPQIRTQEQVAGWKKVTDHVHGGGSVIYLQLWHMGRKAHSSYHPSAGTSFAPSAIAISSGDVSTIHGESVPNETPKAMTIDDIKETIQDYVKACHLAKEAGFDGVEIHGGYGYLLDTFTQSSSNQRTDEYGGSMENRARFSEEIIQAIVDSGSFPANRIGYRLSPNSNYSDMGSYDNHVMFPYIAECFSKYELAYLHVVDGVTHHHGKCPIVTVYDMKKMFGGMVICSSGLTKELGEGMLRSGAADLASYGQLFISNPDLPMRFEKNLPLANIAPHELWWYPTAAKGLTDWPTAEISEAFKVS